MSEQKTLVAKLVMAMNEIGPIAKDSTNTFQKYRFQSEAAIKQAVKVALGKQGIIILPSFEVINQYDRESKKGATNHFVDVLGTFEVTDGQDTITGSMPGSGQDTGEKAMAKACTSAQKYFYKQLFNISDKEEDPDATDSGSYKPKSKSASDDEKASDFAIKTTNAKMDEVSKSIGVGIPILQTEVLKTIQAKSIDDATTGQLRKAMVYLNSLLKESNNKRE